MDELRKFVAPEFVYGPGAFELAGQYATNLGAKRVFLVTDPGVREAGWADRVIASLEAEHLPVVVFDAISPNPRHTEAMDGVEQFQSGDCDLIVAVGGGSPMDCAKAIGVASSNQKHVLEFEGVDNVEIPGPPLICVPTTAGTAADISQFAIINDTTRRSKIAIISKAVVPDVALVDPATTLTMDAHLTACTGIDALVHAVEAFVSNASSPIVDVHALEAVRLVNAHIRRAVVELDNVEVREKLMRASLQAGLAFSNASLGATHAMAHSLGGWLDVPHGEANAMLLNHVVAFNFAAAPDRCRALAEAFELDLRGTNNAEAATRLFDHIGRLRHSVGVTATLGTKGVNSSDIPRLAKNAMLDPCMLTNPRRPTQRDIEVIFEEAS